MDKRVQYENLILDLYLFWRLERSGGNMSTAKLLYLFESRLYEKNMIGGHYKMKRYPMGPYNPTIGNHLKNLAKNGYLDFFETYFKKIEDFAYIIKVNKNTSRFLKNIDELIQENKIIFNEFDKIIYEFGALNGQELKDYIYSLERTGIQNKKIKDYKLYSIILDPFRLKNPKFKFELNDDWYDTIEVQLNPDLSFYLNKSMKELQQGKFLTF